MYKPLVSSAPAHSILNAQAFHYTSSVETDIRKTFARVRRRRAKTNASISVASNVRPFIKKEAEMPPPDTQNKAPGDHVSNTCQQRPRARTREWTCSDVRFCERAADAANSRRSATSIPPDQHRFCTPSIRARCAPDTRARLNTISRCSPPKPSAVADASVWLECSGELIDFDRSTFFASRKRRRASS